MNTAKTIKIMGAVLAILILIPSIAVAAKPKMDTPTLLCGGSTQTSISIQVVAGATGAPAGFTLQWMTAEQYALGGWSQLALGIGCDGSFSGNANLSRYNLGPNEVVTVNVGELLFDQGTSTSCPEALTCGTQYVFRAFAHATSALQRSTFTPDLTCSTLPCASGDTCTFTQGYWKTHGPTPTGNNSHEWPVSQLQLGTVTYTEVELQAILDTAASGNGLIALAHQLIAAKLNVAKGADPTDVQDAITAADALIGGLVVPPVGAGFLKASVTSALTTILTNYNEGATGPGHCE
jgi:hypothetical protein